MNRPPLPTAVADTRVIAVLRGLGSDRVAAVSGVLRHAGITVLEVTMDSPDVLTSLEACRVAGAAVGAGTVMSVDDAEAAVAAGATFLVSPHTDDSIVRWAVERGIPVVPGAFTPTEVAAAWNAGSTAVKIFPASVAGPGLLEALQGPFGGLPLIPTGGITADNAASFLAVGAVAVGVGDWLTDHTNLNAIADRATSIVEACRL